MTNFTCKPNCSTYITLIVSHHTYTHMHIYTHTGKPNSEEFSYSSNAFEYSGEMLNIGVDLSAQGLLRPKSGYFKGYYMMDNNGKGELEKYLDNEYYMEFEEVGGLFPPRYTVVGKGDSDFGTFVLTGTYNARTKELEMARQYISEDDERCNMSVSQLKSHIITATAREGNHDDISNVKV